MAGGDQLRGDPDGHGGACDTSPQHGSASRETPGLQGPAQPQEGAAGHGPGHLLQKACPRLGHGPWGWGGGPGGDPDPSRWLCPEGLGGVLARRPLKLSLGRLHPCSLTPASCPEGHTGFVHRESRELMFWKMSSRIVPGFGHLFLLNFLLWAFQTKDASWVRGSFTLEGLSFK